MEIGGIDIVLAARRNAPVAEIVLRRIRLMWPHCVFEDAERPGCHPISSPWVWFSGTQSTEFFIYRDDEAARAWEEQGATAENQDAMIHVLLGESERAGSLMDVTLVIGSQSPDISALISDLDRTFRHRQAA